MKTPSGSVAVDYIRFANNLLQSRTILHSLAVHAFTSNMTLADNHAERWFARCMMRMMTKVLDLNVEQIILSCSTAMYFGMNNYQSYDTTL